MELLLSVVICTYNPDMGRLNQTISGLQMQSLPYNYWELIIVDNNSSQPFPVDLGWHPAHKIVREERQGLTQARLRGFREAMGSIIVLVDDDNILDREYLGNALHILQSDHRLGAIGGKSLPLFEAPAPRWIAEFYGSLALRDMGGQILQAEWNEAYPAAAPIGAGMVIRKAALPAYMERAANTRSLIADRTGTELSSGGDNDIVLEILKSGWTVGYYPVLTLIHIIPGARMEPEYLARLVNGIQKSWIQVLQKHGINPWPLIPAWTVPLRKIKAWLSYRAYHNKINYLKWRAACGIYDGLAKRNEKA